MYTLITAAASAEAYSLKKTLNTDNVLLGDYLELPDVLLKAGKVIQLPNPQSLSYTHQMLALCLNKDINTVYALRKEEEQLLAEAKQLFTEYNINLVSANDKI